MTDGRTLEDMAWNVRAGSFTVTVSVDLLERNTHSFQHLAELDASYVRRMKFDDVGIWIRVCSLPGR